MKTRRLRRRVLPRIGILLVAAGLAAASPPAQLRGSVVDENGLPVAGVAITAQAPGRQTQTVYTDEAGRFEFRSLAASNYHLSLEKPGFFRLVEQAVELKDGANEVSFTLSHESEVHEEVEVTSSTNRVDPQETAHQGTLVAHEIREVPVPNTHDLKSSLPILPGVLRDNASQLHVAGARVGQVEYRLDGFEINDPVTGDLTARLNVDTVRAVEVQTGRYGAQYAHAGAGVLTLETATGDDRWRFGTTNFIPGINLDRGAHLGNWFPRLTFSGPLRKGRAWFSNASSLQHNFRLVKEQPRGADTTTQWAADNLFRAQVNLTPAHSLQVSFLFNQFNASNLGLAPFTPVMVTTNLDSRRYFVSFKDQIWVQRTLVEFGVAADTGSSDSVPQGSGTEVLGPTERSGSFFENLRRRPRRWQVIGNLIVPSRRWHGSHDLSAGFNVDAIQVTQLAVRGPIETDRLDGTRLRLTTFSGSGQFRLSDTLSGGYVQDSWQRFRPLMVQFGLRADWDRIIQRGLVGPRFSVNILPFRDDRAKLAIGWGIYYQPIDLRALGRAFDQQRVDVFFDATGQNPILGPVVSRFALPPGGLKQPRFYNASIEWLEKIGEKTLAGVHLMARDGRGDFAYENLQPGQPGGIYLLENNRRDRYRSVEVSLRHGFGENAEVFGSYTRSRARSNKVLDYSLGALVFAPQASGPLDWDTPNRLISAGWAPAPVWNLLLSYFFEYRSGFPFSVINQAQQLVGPPNRLRFPNYVSLNIGIEKRFRLRGHEWAARLAVVNLTDHRNSQAVINNIDAPRFLTFAGGQGRALTGRLRLVTRK
jgi:hypothetical protein